MGNKTIWTKKMDSFLVENFNKLTLLQLEEKLKLPRTAVRIRISHFGLRKNLKYYWNDEQIQYVKDNFRNIGNMELVQNLQKLYPNDESWSLIKLQGLFKSLKLKRTPEESKKIFKRNLDLNIKKTKVINLTDDYIAYLITKNKSNLSKEDVLNNKPLLEFKRKQLILGRLIKKHQNNDTTNIHRT